MSSGSPNPYAAPSADQASFIPVMENNEPPKREFRYANRGLARLLQGLLMGNAIMNLVAIGSGFLQLQLLSQTSISEVDSTWNDMREGIIGLISIVLILVTIVVFSFWTIRAHHNVRWFGARNFSISPGWAIGYFFIPFLNLFRPYTAMSELFKASKRPMEWSKKDSGGLVNAWWTFWLLSGFIGQLVFRASLKMPNSVSSLRSLTNLGMFSEAVSCISAILAYQVVLNIQKSQEKWVSGTPE